MGGKNDGSPGVLNPDSDAGEFRGVEEFRIGGASVVDEKAADVELGHVDGKDDGGGCGVGLHVALPEALWEVDQPGHSSGGVAP